jgi:hypothetical protein
MVEKSSEKRSRAHKLPEICTRPGGSHQSVSAGNANWPELALNATASKAVPALDFAMFDRYS